MYYRYIDDMFAIFDTKSTAERFIELMNTASKVFVLHQKYQIHEQIYWTLRFIKEADSSPLVN